MPDRPNSPPDSSQTADLVLAELRQINVHLRALRFQVLGLHAAVVGAPVSNPGGLSEAAMAGLYPQPAPAAPGVDPGAKR